MPFTRLVKEKAVESAKFHTSSHVNIEVDKVAEAKLDLIVINKIDFEKLFAKINAEYQKQF